VYTALHLADVCQSGKKEKQSEGELREERQTFLYRTCAMRESYKYLIQAENMAYENVISSKIKL
jgi:hypothetical protein